MILYTFLVCLFCYLVGSHVALREAERDVWIWLNGFGAGHGSQGLKHAKRCVPPHCSPSPYVLGIARYTVNIFKAAEGPTPLILKELFLIRYVENIHKQIHRKLPYRKAL